VRHDVVQPLGDAESLVGGEHDAVQPPKVLYRRAAGLTSAASVATRIFAAAEHADQHCQMGNLPLATRWMAG
jgi:hypothetical protein